MVAAILFLPFEIRTGHFLTSLNRFAINKIFFITLFFIKRSRLATGQKSPVLEWSGIQMPGTSQNEPFEYRTR